MNAKVCRDCGLEKGLDQFSKQRTGKRSYCKPCGVLRTARWQRENPERKNANALRYYYRHQGEQNAHQRARRKRPEVREKERAYQKKYRKEHPETTVKIWRKRWAVRHPDVVKRINHRRYERNREKITASNARWAAAHPEEKRAISRRTCAKRRALQLGAPVRMTAEQLTARLEFFGNLCWICGAVANQMDHVKPLSKGGAHIPANIRPICIHCNSRKRDRWPFSKEMIA